MFGLNFFILAKTGFSFRKLIRQVKLSFLRILLRFKPDEVYLCSVCFRISNYLGEGWTTLEHGDEQTEVTLCKECVRKAEKVDSNKSIIDDTEIDDEFYASDSDDSINKEADGSLKISQNIKLRAEHPSNGRLSRFLKSKTQKECKYFILKQIEPDNIIPFDQDRIEKVMDESFKLFYSNSETLMNDEKLFLSILITSNQVKAAFEEKLVSFHSLTRLVIKNFFHNSQQLE